jgi:hypothetical protein
MQPITSNTNYDYDDEANHRRQPYRPVRYNRQTVNNYGGGGNMNNSNNNIPLHLQQQKQFIAKPCRNAPERAYNNNNNNNGPSHQQLPQQQLPQQSQQQQQQMPQLLPMHNNNIRSPGIIRNNGMGMNVPTTTEMMQVNYFHNG